jgi:hypothetical protein
MALAATARARLVAPPQTTKAEPPIYLPKAEYLRPMSLGFANVMADVLWFRTISYFGGHYRGDRVYPWLAHMCDLVTDLDPRAEHVYRFAGVILPWEAGETDQGIRLLEKGIRNFPNSWTMHYWLGFTYYFFKSDYEKAAFYMQRAAALPGAHPHAARLAGLLYAKQYGAEAASEVLHDMERNTSDPQMRGHPSSRARGAAVRWTRPARRPSRRTERWTFSLRLRDLVDAGIIAAIPNEPFGGAYRWTRRRLRHLIQWRSPGAAAREPGARQAAAR